MSEIIKNLLNSPEQRAPLATRPIGILKAQFFASQERRRMTCRFTPAPTSMEKRVEGLPLPLWRFI